ncbi:MAG: SDR family oxidoreductase [Halieaceae bacterium]|nr:SDR family oxidoreductase [Halieaceae bacterium]
MSVILVTGASTGIGQETALHFSRQGHDVYASVRNPDTASELKEKIAEEKLTAKIIRLDLVKPDTIKEAVAKIAKDSGQLDVLIANAGIGAGSSVEETELDTVREIFETNYFGNVSLLQAVTPIMRQQRSGHIVMVGSLAGRYAAGCHAHYSASKWAMEGLCESLAQEMAEFNARVTIIEPGCVVTPMWTKVEASDTPPLYPENVKRLVRFFEFGLGRPAMPSDVADAIQGAITDDKAPFRIPVGKDATEVTSGRAQAGDEAWVSMLCRDTYDNFADGWKDIVGVEYYRD